LLVPPLQSYGDSWKWLYRRYSWRCLAAKSYDNWFTRDKKYIWGYKKEIQVKKSDPKLIYFQCTIKHFKEEIKANCEGILKDNLQM